MASGSEPVLRAADLRVERGDTTVLDGLSVSVSAGERALIRGESGAGKTTLFEVLGLLLPRISARSPAETDTDNPSSTVLSPRSTRRSAARRTGSEPLAIATASVGRGPKAVGATAPAQQPRPSPSAGVDSTTDSQPLTV